MRLIKLLFIILLLQTKNSYSMTQQQDGASTRWVTTRALRMIPFYKLQTPLPVYNHQTKEEDPLNPSSVCCTVSAISVSIICAGIVLYYHYFS